MSEDFKLLAKLAADTTQFDSAMKSAAQKTRQFQQTAKDIFQATRSPVQQYAAALDSVRGAYARGLIDMNLYSAATKRLNDEFFAASGGAARLAASLKSIDAGASVLPARLASIQSGFSKFGAAAGATVGKVHGVGIAIAGLVGVAAGKHAFDLAADFDATSASMEVLLRDSTKAKKLMEELYQFAAKTPFEFPEVAAAGKQLITMGESSDEVLKDLRMLGDIALGADVPLSELTDIFRRNSTQAHIFSRDIQEFAGRGIPIIRALAERFKVTDGELMLMVEDGKVGFKDMREALNSLSAPGGQFEGMTDKLGKRMKGIASTAKDDLNSAMRELGNILGETVLPYLAQAAKDIASMAKELRGFEHTDLGKMIESNAERLGQKGALNTRRGVAEQLKANEDETRKLLKRSQELSNNLEVRSGLKGRFGAFFDRRDIGIIQEQLNNLARERAALQKSLRQSANPTNEQASNALRGAGRDLAASIDSAMESSGNAIGAMAKRAAADFRSLSAGFERMKEDAKQAAEEARRAQQIIARTRTPEERFDSEKRVLDYLKKRGQLNDDTYKRALKQAEEQRDLANGTKARRDEMESLKRSLRTPLEEFKDELAHLDELKKHGLDEETFKRAEKKASEQFAASRPEYTSENRALLRGTSEAFSAMNRVNDKAKQAKIAQDQLDVLRRQERLQRELVNAQQNVQQWNN